MTNSLIKHRTKDETNAIITQLVLEGRVNGELVKGKINENCAFINFATTTNYYSYRLCTGILKEFSNTTLTFTMFSANTL